MAGAESNGRATRHVVALGCIDYEFCYALAVAHDEDEAERLVPTLLAELAAKGDYVDSVGTFACEHGRCGRGKEVWRNGD